MKRSATILVAALTAAIYAIAVIAGLRIKDLSYGRDPLTEGVRLNWRAPASGSVPQDSHGDLIRRGALLFNQTPVYASAFTRAKLSCSSCHAEGGLQPFASPMVGLPALFPMYNERAGHMISLEDRVQECFVRSENGRPLDYSGQEMNALVAYITWLSQPQPNRRPFVGRGLAPIPGMKPDAAHGAQVYASQCAGCHGDTGGGIPPLFPPLWGDDSFNDGAGMNDMRKMAAFIHHNMPQNRMGILSAQDSWDVSAFIHSQQRPKFNSMYKHF